MSAPASGVRRSGAYSSRSELRCLGSRSLGWWQMNWVALQGCGGARLGDSGVNGSASRTRVEDSMCVSYSLV